MEQEEWASWITSDLSFGSEYSSIPLVKLRWKQFILNHLLLILFHFWIMTLCTKHSSDNGHFVTSAVVMTWFWKYGFVLLVQVELFRHLHGLSLRWHLSRKTGEVLRVMDRGTDSINNLLNYILFSIFPTITDILVAVGYFISAFNGWFGLIVFITMSLYIGKKRISVLINVYHFYKTVTWNSYLIV